MEGNVEDVENTQPEQSTNDSVIDSSDSTDPSVTECPAPILASVEQEIKQATESSTQAKESSAFEPQIIAFCCNWCSYAGADLAGVSRLQYPPNVRIVRVLCSGRIEPDFVLRSLELGADGVLVAGCHPGDCHYISGNLKAEKRFTKVEQLLDLLGLDKRRARLEWISASEGPKFANTITDFVTQIKEIGPNNLNKK
jgi:F420-non-reducing hydrogenase iron-sulfur subunit